MNDEREKRHVPVAVYHDGTQFRVNPPVVMLSRGARDVLKMANATTARVTVSFPPGVFIESTKDIGAGLEADFALAEGVEVGFYPYQVLCKRSDRGPGAGDLQYAVGNSSPGVIVKP